MKIIIILLFLLGGLLPVVQHGRFALSGFELSNRNNLMFYLFGTLK